MFQLNAMVEVEVAIVLFMAWGQLASCRTILIDDEQPIYDGDFQMRQGQLPDESMPYCDEMEFKEKGEIYSFVVYGFVAFMVFAFIVICAVYFYKLKSNQ